MTFDEITTRVRTQGGFDTQTSNIAVADVQGWINARYRSAVADARYRMVELAVGLTVADQYLYVLDTSVVEVEGLTIDGTPYSQAGTKQVWDLRAGTKFLSRPSFGGVFAQEFDSNGTVELTIYPTPTDAGKAIVALAAVEPVDMVSGQSPIIPADLQEKILVYGAIATGMATIEERLDSAQWYEDQYRAGVQELGRRRRGRLNSGPVQVQVAGYHF